VIDLREPAEEPTDVLCDEITATDAPAVPMSAGPEERIGEAQQPLTPIGWGCLAAGITLALVSDPFCERHPEVKKCGKKFTWGGVGLALMCGFFF
jgi:hypothetical protein